MPKEIARIFLRVTDVRVERVQDITEQDAEREGVKSYDPMFSSKEEFAVLWDSLNAKRGYGWDKNPWVWVYTFERIEKPEGWPKEAQHD